MYSISFQYLLNDDYSGKLARIQAATQNFVGVAGRMFGTLTRLTGLGSLGGLLAGVFSIQQITQATIAYGEAGDRIAETARAAGLGAERYQELSYAAERYGVTQEMLDASLLAFGRNLGRARAGFGEMAEGLRRIGPQFLQQITSTRSVDEALGLVMDKMGKIQDPTQRAAFAMSLFGEAGSRMVEMFHAGREGVDAMAARAHHLGIVMSGPALEAAEAFGDAHGDLIRAFQGLRNVIGAAVLPQINALLNRLTEFIATQREAIGARFAEYFNRLVAAIAAIDFGAVVSGTMAFLEGLREVAGMIAAVIDAVGGIRNAVLITAAVIAGVFVAPLVAALVSIATSILGLVVPALMAIAGVLLGPIVAGIGFVVSLISGIFIGMVTELAVVFGAIPVAIGLIVAGAAALIVGWEPVKAFFIGLWDMIIAGVQAVKGWLVDLIPQGLLDFIGMGPPTQQQAFDAVAGPPAPAGGPGQENTSVAGGAVQGGLAAESGAIRAQQVRLDGAIGIQVDGPGRIKESRVRSSAPGDLGLNVAG